MKKFAIGVNGGFVSGKLFSNNEKVVKWFEQAVKGDIYILENGEKIPVDSVTDLVDKLLEAEDNNGAIHVVADGLVERGDDYAEMYIYEFDDDE